MLSSTRVFTLCSLSVSLVYVCYMASVGLSHCLSILVCLLQGSLPRE